MNAPFVADRLEEQGYLDSTPARISSEGQDALQRLIVH